MTCANASDTVTVRSVFIVGPDKKVKLMITYPASTGQNFDDILTRAVAVIDWHFSHGIWRFLHVDLKARRATYLQHRFSRPY